MPFRLLDVLVTRVAEKLKTPEKKSEIAFRDESEKAHRFVSEDERTTSRKIRERFKEITEYNKLFDTALLLPAQEFERRCIPPFVQLFQKKFTKNTQAFDVLLQTVQGELVRSAAQLRAANPDSQAVGYLPYADAFRARVWREIKESLKT